MPLTFKFASSNGKQKHKQYNVMTLQLNYLPPSTGFNSFVCVHAYILIPTITGIVCNLIQRGKRKLWIQI